MRVVVYEDSGGQLWLWPDGHDTAVVLPPGTAARGCALTDMLSLAHTDGETPPTWTVDRAALPPDAGRPDVIDAPELVASYDPRYGVTIYPERCGNAARAYLGLPRDDELP